METQDEKIPSTVKQLNVLLNYISNLNECTFITVLHIYKDLIWATLMSLMWTKREYVVSNHQPGTFDN